MVSEKKENLEVLRHNKDILTVDQQGARIHLVLDGVPVLGSFVRGDGKAGMTHACTPVFGPDRKTLYGLKQHGNMRNEQSDLASFNDTIIVTHKITDPGYPDGMIVKQMMSVEDHTFSLVMIHTNKGKKKAHLNAGEHCYFDAPLGFEGTTLNGQEITSLIKENVDGIAIPLEETNTIQIPAKPEIELTQNGFGYAMVWVGKNPETKAIDGHYICIEPVEGDPNGDFFESEKSLIVPGQSRSAMFSLRMVNKTKNIVIPA